MGSHVIVFVTSIACQEEEDQERNQDTGESARRPEHHQPGRCGERPLGKPRLLGINWGR